MISKSVIKDIYSLSPMQEGMLFNYMMDNSTLAYIEQAVLTVSGEIDIPIFEQSFNKLIEKHDVLRTIFAFGNDRKPLQGVLKERKAKVEYYDFSTLPDFEKVAHLKDFKLNDANKGFDLKKSIPMRISIIKIGSDTYEIIWTFHHIIMDGWCLGILIKDFFDYYREIKAGISINPKPVKQYCEYIKWLKQQDRKKALHYWSNYLEGFENSSIISPDKEQKSSKRTREKVKIVIEENITRRLGQLANENKVTMNTIIQAAWGVLLSKYNNTMDVTFGAIISGRPPEIECVEDIVGLFINTIPVRVRYSESDTFRSVLKDIQTQFVQSINYGYLTLSEIQSMPTVKQKLVNHILVFENYPRGKMLEGLNVSRELNMLFHSMEIGEQNNYDFELVAVPGKELNISLKYNDEVYSREFIKGIGKQFYYIIRQLAVNPSVKAKDINLLQEEDRDKLLYTFNKTEYGLSIDKTIHKLFEEQVKRTPDNIALVFQGESLSYCELNQKANQLARILRVNEVKQDTSVGIMVQNSTEMVIGMLAIIKAGGTYLPIDSDYPSDRIEYMLKDGGVKILLTHKHFEDKVSFEGIIINLNEIGLYRGNDTDLESISKAEDSIYLIYTSGTTGQPKGVLVENRSLVNYVTWFTQKAALTNIDKTLYMTSFAFDLSYTALYSALLNGCELHLLPKGLCMDAKELLRYIQNNQITYIKATPSIFNMMVNSDSFQQTDILKSLRLTVLGGESINTTDIEKYNHMYPENQVMNHYGPTETTIGAIAHIIDFDKFEEYKKSPVIGRPINNTQVYILDKNFKPMPTMVQGEVYISGVGLARGYINEKELTDQRFIKNFFVSEQKMYRTGDLAKWNHDGNIEFLGRADNQVKIRGFRVELEEIEKQLLACEHIKEAIVIDRTDKNGVKYLCAYIISNKQIVQSEIRSFLLKKLPGYMVPSFFMQIDKIPLTLNGKIDKHMFPDLRDSIYMGEDYQNARNKTEEMMAEIWKEVLGIKHIGINDNFFDMGGHSINAMILIGRVCKSFNVEVHLSQIFASPTISELSEHIYSLEGNTIEEIQHVEESNYYESSSAQKRMYIQHHLDESSIAYNMPSVIIIEGDIEIVNVENSVNELVQRHEILRTSFENINGNILQKVWEKVDFKIKYREAENIVINDLVQDFIKPFDLKKAPLLRVNLFKSEEKKYMLMFDMHHIISDGISMKILINEFIRLYQGGKLSSLKLQYKDYAQWQNRSLQSQIVKKQEEYWLNRLGGKLPILNMPIDFSRQAIRNCKGDRVKFTLDGELLKEIKALTKETGTTTYMLLLSIYNVLLSKYSGQEDIIVGTPVSGRTHTDFQDIIGMFVNMLAMRNHPKNNLIFYHFLLNVKEATLKALENQDYQFEELVKKLNLSNELIKNPIFDTIFAFKNTEINEGFDEDIKVTYYEYDDKNAKFDLSLLATEKPDKIEMALEYSNELYKKASIEKMAQRYVTVLEQVARNKNIRLGDIQICNDVHMADSWLTTDDKEDFDFDM